MKQALFETAFERLKRKDFNGDKVTLKIKI